jgi:hypothetical protein
VSTHVTITMQAATEGFIAVGMEEEIYVGRGAMLFVVTVPLRFQVDEHPVSAPFPFEFPSIEAACSFCIACGFTWSLTAMPSPR